MTSIVRDLAGMPVPLPTPSPARSPLDRPRATELKATMQSLLPGFRERAAQTERDRKVPRENVAALRAAGLFKIVQPRAVGGYEHDFDVLVELVLEAAKGCASTAWVYGLYGAHQWLVASFGAQAQDDVWAADTDPAICGSYAPAGKAILAEGGYRLTGQWHFASGCDNADWALCASIMPSRSEGLAPAPAFFLVPKADYAIEDNWEVAGLCGTGSKTILLDDVFVPNHRLLTFRETTTGQTPGSKIHANPGYGIPMLSNIPSCLAAAAVGTAAGALDQYLEATSQRVTRGAVAGGNNRMAEFATVQIRVSDAAAAVDAAREILLRDLRERATSARDGHEITIEDRITSRRGQAFAVSMAIRAAEALNASTGGGGLALSNPVQRAWRDANAVGRHISLNWDVVGTMYGQMALGLEPKGQY